MVACLFALSWLVFLKLYRQLLYRLAAYQVVGSLLLSTCQVFQFHFMSYDDSKYTLCVIVAYLDQVAALIKLIFGGWVHLPSFLLCDLLQEPYKAGALVYHNISTAPFCDFGHSFSDRVVWANGQWCWIQVRRFGCEYLTGFVEQFVTFYGPLTLLLVLESSAMLIMLVTVYYRSCKKEDVRVFGSGQNKTVFKQLIPLVAYPIIFCTFSIPPLINRVYELTSPNYGLRIFSSTCFPISSLAAGLTLTAHIAIVTCFARRHSYRAQYEVIYGSEEVVTFKQETQTNVNSNTTTYIAPDSTQ
eukprot:Em0565g5a